ncbi:peptidylprolyl isomerase [Cohnella sp. WQ 127256]|uniref:peptidylprolyl isomerase n=1 Tax=Cohnella sp. WQ 127256 TaxID=2938790 RepID=UPI0021194EEC|nr:peptidylprolyl isomerase [Cohnella sp. WQ 127256]
MSERNDNELNDREQEVTNDEIEREIQNNEVELNKPFDVSTSVSAATPSATATKSASSIVPWIIAVIAIVALVFVLVKNTAGDSSNETIGKLDGVTIKQSDAYAEIAKQMGEDQMISLVDSIAQNKIIELESDKAGIKITDEDIKKEMETIKKMYGMTSDEDLNAALQQSNITLEVFKEQQVLPQLRITKLFMNTHPVSQEDLQGYFEKNKETFATTPKEVKASHILLQTQEEADAVLAELKAGKDFATLAKEKSQDPGSKDAGGDLGFFGRGMMNEGFETAAFALAKGEMSDVVSAESGFHIIKVTDIKEPVIPTYDEVKDEVKDAYYLEKLNNEAKAWLESLKKDRNYKNLLVKEPEATASPSASPEASSTAPASPEASPSASAAQ